MTKTTSPNAIIHELRKVRQSRYFTDQPVSEDDIIELLEVAQWTGSSKNTQPWHFIVITDKEKLRQISDLREVAAWVAEAPLAIAIVLNGTNAISEAYDEGRVTERLMIAARALGLGAGTAWYGDADLQAKAKTILGIPEEMTARSVVVIGHPADVADQSRGLVQGGRKPLSDLVSYQTFGGTKE